MKPLVLVCLGSVAICASAALGAAVAEDAFAYPDGPLNGQNGGTGAWTTQWTNNGLDVVLGEAVTNVFANPPKYVARGVNDPTLTNEFFVKITITTPPSFATTDYFAVALTIGVNNTVLAFGKGVNHNNWTITGVFDSGIAIAPSTTYNLVAAVTYAHDAVPASQLLWINPDASDYYNPVTGDSSADLVGHDFAPNRTGLITLYSNLPGVKFDNLLLCDEITGAIPSCVGDINGDGATNSADFNILASHFGQAVPPNTNGDLTGDGLVNSADFNILAGDFGCP